MGSSNPLSRRSFLKVGAATVAGAAIISVAGIQYAHSTPTLQSSPRKIFGPAVPQWGPTLAVINTGGQVWARSISSNSVGPGIELTGPSLFGGPDDEFVVASEDSMAVITKSGAFWPRTISDTTVSAGSYLSGSLFGGGSPAKYALYDDSWGIVYVINAAGQVWVHWIGSTVGAGTLLNGPGLFGSSNYKYVVYDTHATPARILVVNTLGQVWAHDLTLKSSGISFGPPNTVGAGYMLSGSSLFGAPNDKYVLCDTLGRLLVVNTLGQVWAHDLSNSSAIGGGVELSGPALFGTDSNDKYVVAYNVEPPQPPPK